MCGLHTVEFPIIYASPFGYEFTYIRMPLILIEKHLLHHFKDLDKLEKSHNIQISLQVVYPFIQIIVKFTGGVRVVA